MSLHDEFKLKVRDKTKTIVAPYCMSSRRIGANAELRLLDYLQKKYPNMSFELGNGKQTYDIYSTWALFDSVGVDTYYRLIMDHKLIKKHKNESRFLKRPGFIAFEFPRQSGYWFFLPVSSKFSRMRRPVVDGRVLAACVQDPIYKSRDRILKADWFRNALYKTTPLPTPLPHGWNNWKGNEREAYLLLVIRGLDKAIFEMKHTKYERQHVNIYHDKDAVLDGIYNLS